MGVRSRVDGAVWRDGVRGAPGHWGRAPGAAVGGASKHGTGRRGAVHGAAGPEPGVDAVILQVAPARAGPGRHRRLARRQQLSRLAVLRPRLRRRRPRRLRRRLVLRPLRRLAWLCRLPEPRRRVP